MAARPFLELTKLQNRILFEYVRKEGFAEGVQKLYQRLRRDIANIQHPAMNSKGDVALLSPKPKRFQNTMVIRQRGGRAGIS